MSVAPLATRRLAPRERLEALCDEGSLQVVRSAVRSERMGDRARDGDGVLGAIGTVRGRPVACYAQDGSYAGGSLGEAHADTIGRVLELAERGRAPVVGFIESGGARLQEGTGALNGYARVFRSNVALSGVVPQISIVCGVSAGGGCYSPALTDFTVMTEESAMFLTGPGVVGEVLGEDVSAAELGGRRVHERNGVAQFVVPGDVDAVFLARDLLGYLPSSAGDAIPVAEAVAPDLDDPAAPVPSDPRRVYDVRDALRGFVDGDSLLEVAPRWARNIVTALARIDGRPVAIVANQPHHLGGVIDAAAAEKGARFIDRVTAFGLPLIAVVDTPGFMPGTRQESAGVIRHGAGLVRAFAQATVPRLTVILRKSYGGAYITMNSKDLGADLVLAWRGSELGVMGAGAAVGVVHRRTLSAAEDPEAERAQLAAAYAEQHLGAGAVAASGHIDEVIDPARTRARLAGALTALAGGLAVPPSAAGRPPARA